MARAMSRFRCRLRKNASPRSARSKRPSRSSSVRKAASITARSTTSRSPCITCGTGSKTCSSQEPDPAFGDEPGILKMSTSPIYLAEADVGRLVTVKDAIATLEALFATWGQPSTSNLPRQRARPAGGAFNLMGAAYGAKGVHGLKAYAGVKGAQYHTLLYSSLDGKLKAMIEADLFGQLRTGAATGLATRLMANPDVHTLGVIGTGRQSRTQ